MGCDDPPVNIAPKTSVWIQSCNAKGNVKGNENICTLTALIQHTHAQTKRVERSAFGP